MSLRAGVQWFDNFIYTKFLIGMAMKQFKWLLAGGLIGILTLASCDKVTNAYPPGTQTTVWIM